MKYLFFDIECAKHDEAGAAICSFGYVVTDGDFNILEQEDILINPMATFQWFVVKNILAYPKKVFFEQPKFNVFYPRIKELIITADIVVGHSVDNDADYILDEIKRYRLPSFDYKFYDSQLIFNGNFEHEGQISLAKMYAELGLGEPENMHRSDEDSRATMLAVQRICSLKETTLEKLVESTPYCSGRVENGKIILDRPVEPSLFTFGSFPITSNKINNRNGELFRYFYYNLRPSKSLPQTLKGKTVNVSSQYRKQHFREMLILAQEIVNRGGRFREFSRGVNVYVAADGEELPENLARAVEIGNVKKMTVSEFLGFLELDEKKLESMPVPYFNPELDLQSIRREVKASETARRARRV